MVTVDWAWGLMLQIGGTNNVISLDVHAAMITGLGQDTISPYGYSPLTRP